MERCTECNAITEEMARCKTCKRNEYYLKKGIGIGRCSTCDTCTRVFSNGDCKECLDLKGLKECKRCQSIHVKLLLFNRKQAVCKNCLRPRVNAPKTYSVVSAEEIPDNMVCTPDFVRALIVSFLFELNKQHPTPNQEEKITWLQAILEKLP